MIPVIRMTTHAIKRIVLSGCSFFFDVLRLSSITCVWQYGQVLENTVFPHFEHLGKVSFSLLFIVYPLFRKQKKCVPLRDTPKSVPLECYHTFLPTSKGERIRFYQKAVFPLEMGIYSKMCGAYIIHQNPVIVNMDFGISPRESERERHNKNFVSGDFKECKCSPCVRQYQNEPFEKMYQNLLTNCFRCAIMRVPKRTKVRFNTKEK